MRQNFAGNVQNMLMSAFISRKKFQTLANQYAIFRSDLVEI